MGCWNGTCAVSNLHITNNQRVAVFMLLENKNKKSFCYNNAAYDICPIPFYGNYNDYGAVEDCEGFGLTVVVEAIRAQLYKFGQGDNECHDCEVTKENFDIEKLFEADAEDRLGIEYHDYWNADDYARRALDERRLERGLTESQQYELDRLASKIKKEDNFRRVTHVIIHGDVFDSIMQKWYIEEYVGKDNGKHGYENSYNHVYFKDIEDSIPAYIADKKAKYEQSKKESNPSLTRLLSGMRGEADTWKSANYATKWLNHFSRDANGVWGLIDVKECVDAFIEAEAWDDLAAFVKEALIGAWINMFMVHTRKLWTQQSGMGSQSNEGTPYILLADTVKAILEAEKAEYDRDNFDSDQMDLFYDQVDEDVEEETE